MLHLSARSVAQVRRVSGRGLADRLDAELLLAGVDVLADQQEEQSSSTKKPPDSHLAGTNLQRRAPSR